MATAVPRKPPQQPSSSKAFEMKSLKQRLIQSIVRGDEAGAQSMREQLHMERIKLRASHIAASLFSGLHRITDGGKNCPLGP